MSMNLVPIQLEQLAKQIKEREKTITQLKGRFVKAGRELIAEVILQGADLIEAKSKAKESGQRWTDDEINGVVVKKGWLSINMPQISERTAQVYMSIAKAQHAAVIDVSDADSIRDAVKAISEGKEEAEPSPSLPPIRLPSFANLTERRPVTQWTEIERTTFKAWFRDEVTPIYQMLEQQS